MPKLLASIALVAAVAGCAAPGGMRAVSNQEPTFVRLTEERVFAQALRQRYLELATNAYDRAEFDRSDFYTLRAIMAVEGKLVEPAGADEAEGEFAAARIRLTRSLADGARNGAPDLAARSQAAYDCWWLESQAGGDPAIAEACRFNTFGALAEIETVGVGTRIAQAKAADETKQIVVNTDMPSQTIDAGGTTIQIINQPVTYEAAQPAPVVHHQDIAPLAAFQPEQHRQVLSRTTQPVEPMRSSSQRTFVVEAPQPAFEAPTQFVPITPFIADTVAGNSFEPVDLIPRQFAEPVSGGQYIALDERAGGLIETVPIPDNGGAGFFEERSASLVPKYGPVFSETFDAQPSTASESTLVAGEAAIETLVANRVVGASDYSVFFGFDSDKITLEAEDVLIDAVERLVLEDRGTVALMGFTDSAGDSRYNQLLAMRRANAVRKYLQDKTGVRLKFEIMPVGEVEAVRTGGDGIAEALNRRVEIMLR